VESVEWREVTFHYPDAAAPALSSVSLSVRAGEFVVLGGPTGSGKTTLLRLLKREVSPGGRMSGRVLLGDIPIEQLQPRDAAASIGLVMQHPDNQLVVDTVEHELSFGMENLGMPRSLMRRRMAEVTGFFGIEQLLSRQVDGLSGGQKQTVNLASVLMLQPRVLLLDEPLAQLDPLAAREVTGMVKRLNEEWGITVIMSEHRLDELLPLADRLIRMENGTVVFDGAPRAFAAEAWRGQDPAWLESLPIVTRWALAHSEDASVEPPLSVKEARQLTGEGLPKASTVAREQPQASSETASPQPEHPPQASSAGTSAVLGTAAPLLAADGLFYAYSKQDPAVVHGLRWTIRPGDRIALFGGNGSGKSTLLQLLAGLRKPQRGEVKLGGQKLSRLADAALYARIGYLAQNPLLHYAHDTLLEDLLHAAARAGAVRPQEEAERIADRMGLFKLLGRHPHDLSGGERQLGALALLLLGRPQLLLLDEPTKGVDALAKARLARHLDDAHRDGATLVMATHDVEFAASFASRCSLLFNGEIIADDVPEAFFRGNLFYATPLHRLLHGRSAEGGLPYQAASSTEGTR